MPRNFSRLVLLLGAALLAAAPSLRAQQTGAPVRGDVDGDGRVTAADARIVSDFLVGKPVPAGADVRARGDVNGDGRVTSVDAAIIAAAAAGRDVSRFPVGKAAPDAAAVLECTGDVRTGSVECHAPGASSGGARGNIIVGGQNLNLKITSANNQLVAPDTFQFTVTVQNLLHQAMAADSGTGAANATGVRVFFFSGPNVTGGPAGSSISVANADGMATFNSTNQRYFQYSGAALGGDGVLSPTETSQPRTWKLQYTGSPTFTFLLYVSTPMKYPKGWVDIYPPNNHYSSPDSVFADTLQVGGSVQLQDSVRNPFGGVIPGADASWSGTSHGAATVDVNGLVTAVAPGVDTVTATHGPRSGRVKIVVAGISADSTLITAAPTSIAANDTSLITVQVRDEFGHNVTTGGATVSLTTDLGTLVGATTGTTVNAVDQGNGTYTAKLTGTTAGTATVTGTLNGNPILDNATVAIGSAALDHFAVEAAAGGNIGDQLVNTAFNVKVTAKDQYNNTVTTFTGTVGFTSTPGGGITAGAGPSAAFSSGVLGSHSITMGTTGDYTLTATRTGGTEAGTSNSFQVQAPPTAVADGPTPTSAPGDPYHTAFNTTFNLPALGLMVNDTRGLPLATVVSFGGDSLTGTVADHAAGSTVSPLPGHANGSLKVNADGSVEFTPPTGFTGLYVFTYRIGNVRGTSDAQATIAVGVRPAANNDTYPANLLGNVPINTATSTNFNVATNDAGDAKVLELGTATNGTAVLNPNGTFTFTPNAGYTGAASFTYTVKNGFGTTAAATVSMTVSGIAWFVDKGAAAGDGRFGTPFNDLSTAFAAATKPLANQPIFLYHDPTSYTGGVTLLAGQRLVGEGATGASFAAVMGVSWPADAGTQPSIGGTRPTVVSGLTLGSGNTLQGFNLGGAGTLSGTTFGTLTVNEVAISTTGQALNLTTGTITGALTGVTSSGGTNNIALSGVTLSGAFGLGGGALSGATGTALLVTNGISATTTDSLYYSGSIGNSTASASVGVSGGSTRLSLSGNVSQSGAGAVVSVSGGHTGTLNFNTGTVSASTGTGLQFDNADGSYAFNNGVSLTGGDAAIDVVNGSGGTFTFPAASQITNPTNEAIRINSSSPTFTYLGRIDKTNGTTGITVSSNSSGTISFGSRRKLITSTGSNVAVNLATNGTATITSLDSLQITSATGTGYNATGGGTVNVAGSNNTVSTSGGVGVNIQNTTIGGSNVIFRSVNKTTGSNYGIRLENTGASGGFKVTGDGSTANSGGIIVQSAATNSDSAAITATSTGDLSLQFMRLSITTGSGSNGIVANELSGTNLVQKSTIDFNSVAPDAVPLNPAFAARFVQSSSTTITLDAVTLQNKMDGNAAGSLSAGGSGTVNFNVIDSNTGDSFNSTMQNNVGLGWVISSGDSGGAGTVNLTLSDSKFLSAPSNGANTLVLGANAASTMNYKIRNNTFSGVANLSAITGIIRLQSFDSAVMGSSTQWDSISGNTITNSGTSSAATDLGYIGISIAPDPTTANTTNRFVIANNTITDLWRQGILVSTRGTMTGHVKVVNNVVGTAALPVGQSGRRGLETDLQNSTTMNLEVTGNSFYATSNLDTRAAMGIRVGNNSGSATLNATVVSNSMGSTAAGNNGRFSATSEATGTGTMCLDLRTNTLDGGTKSFTLTQSAGTFRVEGAGAGAVTGANITSANTVGTGTVSGTVLFNNSTNCTQPPI